MIAILTPAVKDYLWGGTRLKTHYHKASPNGRLAETWELSCHPNGESSFADGDFVGTTLREYLKLHPEALGSYGGRFSEFPMLVKLIDAAQPLSIQVHPDDGYALAHEGKYGKTEMWVVVEAKPGAFLYYGIEKALSPEEFAQRIANDTLLEVLHAVPVKAGDVFFVEAGTIHAIGAGILIAEIQQSSDITYRIFDYGRTDASGNRRPLHTEAAKQVSRLTPTVPAVPKEGTIGDCEYFSVERHTVAGSLTLTADATSFVALLLLSGELTAQNEGEQRRLTAGQCAFVSANSGEIALTGDGTVLAIRVGAPKRYRIGIDLGGTNIKAGVVDSQNRILAKFSCSTETGRPWQEIIADMAMAVKEAVKLSGISIADCDSIGIGSPGTVDAKAGVVVYSNNFGWENVPLAAEMRKYFSLPIAVSNDANCAALGEVVAGAAKGCQTVVLLTLGTGVGGGVIYQGKLLEGGGAGGAELGHTTLIDGGEPCTCGRNGCLEAYCSATALIREARNAAAAHPESLLAKKLEQVGEMNGKLPFDAAAEGDAVAQAVVDRYIAHLGSGIVNMVNIFRPELVLLSGGVCNQQRVLTDPLDAYVAAHAFAGNRVAIPKVKIACLGNDAGILGAAHLGE